GAWAPRGGKSRAETPQIRLARNVQCTARVLVRVVATRDGLQEEHMARSILTRTALLLALPIAAVTGLMAPVSCTNEPAEEPTGESFQKIVYVVRQHTTINGDDVNIDVSGGMGQVMDYLRYNPGAR